MEMLNIILNNKSKTVIKKVSKDFGKVLDGINKANNLLEEEIALDEQRYFLVQMQVEELERVMEGINESIIQKENDYKANLQLADDLQSIILKK
jgi:hypothetical protein